MTLQLKTSIHNLDKCKMEGFPILLVYKATLSFIRILKKLHVTFLIKIKFSESGNR